MDQVARNVDEIVWKHVDAESSIRYLGMRRDKEANAKSNHFVFWCP